jgi:ABC-type multidrug transport system ATPase subunit
MRPEGPLVVAGFGGASAANGVSPWGVQDAVLSDLGLAATTHGKVETCSRRMPQRLHIARRSLADPRLLRLDEQTIGPEPDSGTRLWASI